MNPPRENKVPFKKNCQGLKGHTLDGRNPAPPQKPWNDDSLISTNKQWFYHGFKVQDFATIHSTTPIEQEAMDAAPPVPPPHSHVHCQPRWQINLVFRPNAKVVRSGSFLGVGPLCLNIEPLSTLLPYWFSAGPRGLGDPSRLVPKTPGQGRGHPPKRTICRKP